jgi:hypothetical protein
MNRLVLPLLALLLAASATFAQTARVQIIHNAPDPTVDLYVNGAIAFDDVAFRTATPFLDLPAGLPLSIAVAPSTSMSAAEAIATFDVTFESGQTYVVAASGIPFNIATPFTLITDPAAREAAIDGPTNVNLSVLHGAPDAPAVDVVVRTGSKIVSNLAYGQFTPYLSVPAAEYFVDVKAAGSEAIVATYRLDLTASGGKATKILASGLLNGTPGFGLYAVFADGEVRQLPLTPVARVQLIHNSPSPTVDVYKNGGKFAEDLAYRSALPFMFIPADAPMNIGVALSTSTSVNDTLVNFTYTFENGKTYIVTAAGIVGDATTPFNLNINDLGREIGVDTAKVDIAVLHGATNAPAVDVDAVFVADNVVSNLAYGQFTPYLSLDPTKYDLAVRAAGNPAVVASYRADLSGLKGQSAYVFASGLLGGSPAFGLFAALADGSVLALPATPTARVQIVHNAPNPTVDVYAGNTRLINDFAFRTATPFVTIPADRDLTVGVALANSTSAADVLFPFPVSFESGKTYAVFASGLPGNPTNPFTIFATEARETGSNANVDIAVLHGSPGTPNVDVDAVFVANNVVNNLAYGQFTPYLNLPPTLYDLQVRVAGTPNVVETYRADLSALGGAAGIVFASGVLSGGPAFGLYAALPNGSVLALPITPTARVQIVHNSPSPTVDVYAGNTLLLNDFAFRTSTPFVDFPAERPVRIGVALGSSTSVADTLVGFPVAFSSSKSYTVFANGVVGSPTTPFTLAVADDALEIVDPGVTSVSVFHGAPNAPAVDIAERLAGTLINNVAYGAFTSYLDLPPGDYVLDVKPAGSQQIAGTFEADLSGLGGVALRVFASGFLGNEPAFGLFAVLPDGTVRELPATRLARAQIIHNSPSPTVDVYVNGELALDDFGFRTATGFDYVPAGVVINVGIALSSSQSVADTLVNFPVVFENGKTYVVVASGLVGNQTTPFTLIVNDLGRERANDPSSLELAILHGAPDAPAVDLRSYPDGTTILGGLEYGDFVDYEAFDPAVLFLELSPSSAPNQSVGIWGGDFEGADGLAAVVFASGLLSDGSFDLWLALADGFTLPLPSWARVQVIHNAPNPTVDVYYADDFSPEGFQVLDDFAFRQATGIGLFPARSAFDLAVAPDNSAAIDDAIYTLSVPGLETSKTYVIMAAGVVGGSPAFGLVVNENGRDRALNSENAEFSVFHGSPDAPAVDIKLLNGPVIVNNISFGEFSDYLSVPATDYVISVTPADDNNTIVQSYFAPLSGLQNQAFTVFASGFLGGQQPDFEVWVALTDGTTFPLPVYLSSNELDAKLESLRLAPNPATSEVWVRLLLSEGESLRYAVRDVAGRLMLEGDFGQVAAGEFAQRVEVGQLAAGMYQLEILSDAGQRTQKFVVQR